MKRKHATIEQNAGMKPVDTCKIVGHAAKKQTDVLSVEEPLEIRLSAALNGESTTQPVAVTMRTPGEDLHLAVGFLFTEGILKSASDIEGIIDEKCNVIEVKLRAGVEVDSKLLERHSFMASSCGICGKKSIAAVRVKQQYHPIADRPIISTELVHQLPDLLRSMQDEFDSTGGIHASALFDINGKIIDVKEDVGRHNALDKIIGAQLMQSKLPLNNCILLVSGRASFELVQKAAHAGIPILAAVGAPSSLAVELATDCNMTLLGFVRNERFNIYCGQERIATPIIRE